MGLVVGLAAILASGAFADVAAARPAPQVALAPLSGPTGTWVWVRGSDFRPRGKGIVVFGADRVASFRATERGTFRAGFAVPAGDSGLLGLTVRQSARGRHRSVRRLDRASTRFRVVVGGLGGGLPAGGLGGLPAAGSEGAPGGTPGVGGGALAPPTPAATLPPVPKEEPKKVAPKEEPTPKEKAKEEPAPKEEPKEKAKEEQPKEEPKEEPKKEPPKEEPKEEPKETPKEEPKKEPAGSWWVPPKSLTWYWQIQGTVNNSEPVAAYDIDGFENTAAEVSTLHGKGIHVICYIDVGTWEEWRSDESEFPASVIGDSNGWPGEKYLNIADTSVLEPIMTKRFEMCKEKGFDAVEPDNIEDYAEQGTGFTITAAEQLTYDEWIATEAHSLGMAVLQKNDGEQTSSLESHFDGALTEQCNQYSECESFDAYLTAGKPVLNAEYELATSAFCSADNTAGIMGARFGLELNGTTFEPCW